MQGRNSNERRVDWIGHIAGSAMNGESAMSAAIPHNPKMCKIVLMEKLGKQERPPRVSSLHLRSDHRAL